MLVELRIRDYAVIEDLTLGLGSGLNVLTGETGAGKSIIVGALSLLLGERASSEVVRAGAKRATVEAAFEVASGSPLAARVEDLGFRLEEGLLLLRREVAVEGRNRAWVNGSLATAGVVGELGRSLVDLHGQHEHQTLLRTAEQRAILDAFAGATDAAAEVQELHGRCRSLGSEAEAREARAREIETRADFLRFQLGEIEGAKLTAGEDAELEAEARRREHSEELVQGASGVHEALYAGDASVADQLADARSAVHKLLRFDTSLEEDAHLLDDAYHSVQEAGRHLGEYAAGVDHDPGRLDEIHRRLDLIFRLKQKYGPELTDVLAAGERVGAELAELDNADHEVEEARRQLEEARGKLQAAALKLTELRREAAQRLSEAVGAVLPELGLPEASFDVRLKPLDDVGSAGSESVEFLVAPNPGFEPMSLARIASGGELSRVMLAIKSILADVDRIPVLVFDEIDAGIGGVVAGSVAAKLSDVARRHQVFVVTHLAQLAARSTAHLLVEKEQGENVTTTRVRALEGEDRVEEIARMLAGDPGSEASREHAREMLETPNPPTPPAVPDPPALANPPDPPALPPTPPEPPAD